MGERSSVADFGDCGRWRGGAFAEIPVKLELLKQADVILSKCGRPTLPGGVTCVPLVKNIVVPMVLEPGQTTVFMKEIPGDTLWCLEAISSDQGSNSIKNIRLQVQFPDGHFLFGGNGQDIGQFAWVGSYRFLMAPDLDYEPGGKLKVTLTDTTPGGFGASQAVNLVFEGSYKYFLQGGERVADAMKLASSLPKYRGDSNENILAQSWVTGAQPQVPDGYVSSEEFTYSSEAIAFTIGTSSNGQLTIPIDESYDFFVRRILTDIQFAGEFGPPSGIVLGRCRTGTGYSFNDDFIDLARYLCGAEWAKDWKVRGRDSIVIDLQTADVVGVGTITYQVHLEGVRRRKT
jgi:hypothetical protein